jgi:CRP-like cAMP-binding protein
VLPLADALGAYVPQERVSTVAALFRRKAFRRADILLAQGERWTHAVLLERGLIRLYFVRRDGREFNKNFYAEGALVCPLHPCNVERRIAVRHCGARIEHDLARADAAAFRKTLGAAWEPLQRELLVRLISHKLQREHDLLALDGRLRYVDFCRRQPGFAQRVPLVHLATYLGLTDVSLSRIRRSLRGTVHL